MHFALLLGYGASAINPYLAFAVVNDLVERKEIQLDYHTAEKNYIKAIDKGLLKIISKMQLSRSTIIRSYRIIIYIDRDLFQRYGIENRRYRYQ